MNKMSSGCDRIAKIVRGLKMFSRDGRADPFEPFSFSAIVKDSLTLCEDRVKQHGIKLFVNESADIKFDCRPSQISQILVNLIGNAHDAIEKSQSPWIKLDWRQVDGFIEFSVTDSGSGIPLQIQEKLLQPFFTTKPVGKGTGLGLSISKGIIDAHHGTLTIDNSCANTRFVVRIPLKYDDSSTEIKAA